MDFELPWEIRAIQANVRKFVEQELFPLEFPESRGQALKAELLAPLQDKIKAMGLWLLDVPEEYGGPGLSLLARCVVQEEVAKTTALPFRHHELFGPVVGPILYACKQEQKDRFLYPVIRGEFTVCFAQTEAAAGSDPAGIRTRAVRSGDVYIVNGTKRFISEAEGSRYAQVICVTDPEASGRGISCLMVDMRSPGATLGRREQTMMGDEPSEMFFQDVRVPVENLIGAEGDGFRLAQEWLTVGRVRTQAAWCVGVAQRALEMTMRYASERWTFGQPLSTRQAIEFMIADSAIEMETARLLVHKAAWLYDQKQDLRDLSYMAKIVCAEVAGRVVDRAIQVHGGVGLTPELPLEYWYRQLRSIRITEGATEVLRWRLARNLFKRLASAG